MLNVWVAPLDKPNSGRPLTAEQNRPIRNAFWSPDSKSLLFINDKGGDENYLLYGVNVYTGVQASLTPFEKTRVQLVKVGRNVKDRILIGVNNRDPKWHDVHSLDLATGKLTLVQQNDGWADFVADDDLKLRMAAKSRDDGGTDYYRWADGKADPAPAIQVALDDSLTTNPLGFTAMASSCTGPIRAGATRPRWSARIWPAAHSAYWPRTHAPTSGPPCTTRKRDGSSPTSFNTCGGSRSRSTRPSRATWLTSSAPPKATSRSFRAATPTTNGSSPSTA
ncbi:MAG TPA: hypothetical protein VGC21_13000 [Telluria sp.]